MFPDGESADECDRGDREGIGGLSKGGILRIKINMDWKFTKDNPLKVVTLCSGYDSQCMALRNIGIPFDLVGWSEIDKYAIMAHDAVFPEWKDRNLGDMTKIDWGGVPDFQLLTYSTPCTDFSNAGKQAGGEEGSGTRSSILWYTRNAIITKKPKYLLMENVKALVSEKFRPLFLKWCNELTSYGYTNFMQVLNAKDYGIPQNRERIFVVSILGDAWFDFPQKVELKLKLKDMLEDNVHEKYFLPQDKVNEFVSQLDDEKKALMIIILGSVRYKKPINVTNDGCAFTIVSRYEGRAYLKSMTGGGGYYPCTGVLEILEDEFVYDTDEGEGT